MGDVQQKLENLKSTVKEKQNAKKQLEKQIVLIKTTKSDTINKSMKKYLNGELAYDLESLTHKLELVEQQEDDRSIKSAASGTTYTDYHVAYPEACM
jgi:septal ring factor EnvC (AmiA/AmiB activator)